MAGRLIPVLILRDGEISSIAIDYVLHILKRRSITTVSSALRAVALLFDFHATRYGTLAPSVREQERFFDVFSASVENGTTLMDGSDPTGLGWASKTAPQVRKVIRACLSFLEYAARREDVHGLGGFSWLLQEKGNEDAALKDQRAPYSLLAHLHRPAQNRAFQFMRIQAGKPRTRRAVGFPSDKIYALIQATLQNTRASKAARVRDAMAYCLLAYGGLRSSEPLHLWLNDISQDDASGRVFVRHPSDFTSNVGGKRTSRRELLADRYNMSPRHLSSGRLHAGWKGMSFDYDHTAVVYWIDPRAGALFSTLHRQWILHLRPSASDHPFYFVNLDEDGDYGGPWTMAGFRRSFYAACRRINLQVAQTNGVNPHGLRHFYGLMAETMKLPNNVIQQMMHHVSILSQEIYKQARPEEISHEIVKAARNLESGELSLPAFRDQVWNSDPRSLFPNWRHG